MTSTAHFLTELGMRFCIRVWRERPAKGWRGAGWAPWGVLPWQTIALVRQMDWQDFVFRYAFAAMVGFIAGLLIFLVKTRAGRQWKRNSDLSQYD
jgi:hypothetical protein